MVLAVAIVAVAAATVVTVGPRLLPAPGSVPVLLVLTVGAAYACVPETDHLPPLAVGAAMVAAVELLIRHHVHVVVDAALAVLVAWGALEGVSGRESALVGAVFAWWPGVLLPLIAVARPSVLVIGMWRRWLVVAIAAIAAIAVARTGALEPTVGPAFAAVAIAAPVSAAAALVTVTTGVPSR